MDYLYIRAWGKMLHSFDYYVQEQVRKAREDKAPEDATYFNGTEWRCWSDMEDSNSNKAYIQGLVDQMKG